MLGRLRAVSEKVLEVLFRAEAHPVPYYVCITYKKKNIVLIRGLLSGKQWFGFIMLSSTDYNKMCKHTSKKTFSWDDVHPSGMRADFMFEWGIFKCVGIHTRHLRYMKSFPGGITVDEMYISDVLKSFIDAFWP